MILAGILVNHIDGRILLGFGLGVLAYSTFLLSHINLGISIGSVALPNLINGFAGGFIFVPLTTMTMSRLRKQEIGNAAGIYNLMRNIGGSVGIASVTTMLVRGAQIHQSYLAANLTGTTPGLADTLHGLQGKFCLGGASAFYAHQEAMGTLYRGIQQQASLLAYADNFWLLGFLSLLCIPLAVLFHRVLKQSRRPDVTPE
jgi:DHA2 family multidrug resistance protein